MNLGHTGLFDARPKKQAPVNDLAQTYSAFRKIVTHPAFRLGFLDAQNGKPFDHDQIVERIYAETPTGALERLGWNGYDLFAGRVQTRPNIEMAQWRYEEGRLVCLSFGIRCKAWGHPDYPPACVRQYIEDVLSGVRQRVKL